MLKMAKQSIVNNVIYLFLNPVVMLAVKVNGVQKTSFIRLTYIIYYVFEL